MKGCGHPSKPLPFPSALSTSVIIFFIVHDCESLCPVEHPADGEDEKSEDATMADRKQRAFGSASPSAIASDNVTGNLNLPPVGSSCYNNHQSFPVKLHYIIETEPRVIRWNRDHKSFQILYTSEFERRILTQHFRTSRITSFTRNLNIYGFKKIVRGDFIGSYYHPSNKFRRDASVETLASMKRSTTDPRTIAGMQQAQSNPSVSKFGFSHENDAGQPDVKLQDKCKFGYERRSTDEGTKDRSSGASSSEPEAFIMECITRLEEELGACKDKVALLETELEKSVSESKKNACLAIALRKDLNSAMERNTKLENFAQIALKSFRPEDEGYR